MTHCHICDRDASAKCTSCSEHTCHDHLLTDETRCFDCREDDHRETIIQD